jgi:hypothetical protein
VFILPKLMPKSRGEYFSSCLKDSKNGKTLLWLCLVAIARNIMHIEVFTLAWTI